MTDIAIRFERVSKRFAPGRCSTRCATSCRRSRGAYFASKVELTREQDFWALKDITFEVEQGRDLGIIGHNGAGKSTMLKHLAGIMRPTRGASR